MKFIVDIQSSLPSGVTYANIKPVLGMALGNLGLPMSLVQVTDYPPEHAQIIADYRYEYAKAVERACAEIWHALREYPTGLLYE